MMYVFEIRTRVDITIFLLEIDVQNIDIMIFGLVSFVAKILYI